MRGKVTEEGMNEKRWHCITVYYNVDALCDAGSGEFVGGGAWGEGQTQSSLGSILQRGVAMETASIVVV